MVAVGPFRALRFAKEVASKTSPPHDCVTEAERSAFVAKDAHNILRVVLPERGPADDATAPHRRAAVLLQAWQNEGILERDAKPAFYLYTLTDGGSRQVMHALVARVALDPTGKAILPHEHTLARKRGDRLLLRQETGMDTEPIWMLYRDDNAWVEELLVSNAFEEWTRFTDEAGIEHRLWRVDRPEAVAEITAQFDDRRLVIADGHHRYRTALEHAQATGRPEHASILTCLVRDSDPGLAIEATHRLIVAPEAPTALTALRQATQWSAEEIPVADAGRIAQRARGDEAVLVGEGAHRAWLLRLREASDDGTPLSRLAVERVHRHLLSAWGITEPDAHLRFTRDAADALARVRSGEARLAVLLPPERPQSVLDVAYAGQLMPQKSTYFVPKPRSGLLLGPLDEAPPRRWADGERDPGKPGPVLRP